MVDPVVSEESSPPLIPHALDGVVAAHAYLCTRAARKFWRAGLDPRDLEQVAAIGLIKATRRFDPKTRTPFEAYAWLTIVGELMHYVRDHERIVRVPRRLHALETPFVRTHERLLGRLGREPSESELADAMGVLKATIADLRAAREAAVPLAIDEMDFRTFDVTGEVSVEDRMLVRAALAELPHLERLVIAGVYVLGLKQLEIAHRLGLTPKRVSRLHRSALGRMQRAWAS